MVKRLATSPHDPLGITDSACKNQSVMVSVQYGPFNPYIPIRSTTIGKSRVAIDPIAMHTSWRSNSDIANSIGYTRMSASGESSTTMHRLLHASGSHPIPTPYDSRTNQYNQDLGLIHSTNGNHLESPNEGSSIDHQARIHEAEDSMQAQHLLIEALVDEKDSLLQTIHGLQEANNAPAPFDGDWEEEPEEEPEEEEIEDIPLGEGEIDDE
ncbi:dentin sialophosphoprotein-like [Dorcoceras hygrometricum]|uniref:Dentin sialophosphoprotein-like n=1 Tax=Dorcoceras hygrometricum TaxID=472368 RepID=A0A2Z7ACS7_9LAMI|nr:dentin sialophosphoprotein-like [Dorcoceras hygrometricum]